MTDTYTPELGQAVFGQPHREFECPDYLEHALEVISDDLERVMTPKVKKTGQKYYATPFGNHGSSFRCPTFCAVSYSWSDDPQPWNFKHYKSGVEVSWYKYAGRGMSVNRTVGPNEAAEILRDCLAALSQVEEGKMTWDEPGLYPEGVAA